MHLFLEPSNVKDASESTPVPADLNYVSGQQIREHHVGHVPLLVDMRWLYARYGHRRLPGDNALGIDLR